MKIASVIIVSILGLGIIVDSAFIFRQVQDWQIKSVVTRKETPTVKEEPAFLPERLIIPALSIDTNIQHRGKDKKGNMDVPDNFTDVSWYSLGAHPGEPGNAVLAGHFDAYFGLPAVFYNLRKLKPGDEIILLDAQGRKKTFVASANELVSVKNPPFARIFGSSTAPHLNLITCGGTWNKKSRSYEGRTVVFADLKSS